MDNAADKFYVMFIVLYKTSSTRLYNIIQRHFSLIERALSPHSPAVEAAVALAAFVAALAAFVAALAAVAAALAAVAAALAAAVDVLVVVVLVAVLVVVVPLGELEVLPHSLLPLPSFRSSAVDLVVLARPWRDRRATCRRPCVPTPDTYNIKR